ncbi:MAG: hypothetical protein A3F18_04475 [Legionellales bacterium RIFCSPHIGHO2_12_FULL_37_14]|nr:MAG: hypothetical protein A3F18_04475 [Legionellales bacterium RIFCSPHIGHO2_12_FULL_37_14]
MYFVLAGIFLAFLVLLIYPIYSAKLMAALMTVLLAIIMPSAYLALGNLFVLQQYKLHKEQQEVLKILSAFKTEAELIEALRKRLDHTPKSAHGWYLLGRLYKSVNEHEKARSAFAEAKRLGA